jgi:hypothetical protein
MIVKSIWLRRIHKWIGLVIGLQFLLWAISGTAMALISMDEVAGGDMAAHAASPMPASGGAWRRLQQTLAGQPIQKLSVRALGSRHVLEVKTANGVRLFDAANGAPVVIDRGAAAAIASHAHPNSAPPTRVTALRETGLAVREHELPIWQVDFRDDVSSSYYVSGTTGAILERRNDSWRWWDFFWMLHNMDYSERTSFNHPLIIAVGFAMAWLATTGFWLLFRTMWRHDFVAIRRLTRSAPTLPRRPS